MVNGTATPHGQVRGAERATIPTDALLIIFDGECALCRYVVRRLKRLDPRRKLLLVPFQQEPQLRALGLEQHLARARREVLVVDARGVVHAGFPGVRQLVRRVWKLWPLLPLLYLPGSDWLGPRLYAWIARHRHTLLHDSRCACATPPSVLSQ